MHQLIDSSERWGYRVTISKHFAILPCRTTDGWLWFKPYWRVVHGSYWTGTCYITHYSNYTAADLAFNL